MNFECAEIYRSSREDYRGSPKSEEQMVVADAIRELLGDMSSELERFDSLGRSRW